MDVLAGGSGTTIPVDGGAGDVLPTQDTAVKIAEQQVFNLDVTANELKVFYVYSACRCHFDVQANDGSSHLAQTLVAGGDYVWEYASGITNPMAGDTIGKVCVSAGDTTGGAFKVISPYGTP